MLQGTPPAACVPVSQLTTPELIERLERVLGDRRARQAAAQQERCAVALIERRRAERRVTQ